MEVHDNGYFLKHEVILLQGTWLVVNKKVDTTRTYISQASIQKNKEQRRFSHRRFNHFVERVVRMGW